MAVQVTQPDRLIGKSVDSSTHPAYVVGYMFAQGLVDMALTGAAYFMPFLLMAAVVAIWKFFMRRNYEIPDEVGYYLDAYNSPAPPPEEPIPSVFEFEPFLSQSRNPSKTRDWWYKLSPEEKRDLLTQLRRNRNSGSP